jgi:hypothetical protein
MKLQPHPAPPMSCYGTFQDTANDTCILCKHRVGCAELMGRRLNRVTLDKLKVQLLPEKYGLVNFGDFNPEERDLQATFAVCHRLVFGTDSDASLSRYRKDILSNARQLKCSVRMFILTNMIGHQKAYPRDPFNPAMMADGRARSRVAQYAEACKSKFAVFDLTALDTLARTDCRDFEINKRMLESEALAADWIVNFKLWNAGKPFDLMFETNEMLLDPNWLAIEPHYEKFIQADLAKRAEGKLREFRHEVIQTTARLKTHRHQAIGNFRARELAVQQTITSILTKFGLKPDHFEIANEPLTDPLHVWSRLGLAIQHVECRRLLCNEKSVYAHEARPKLKNLREVVPMPLYPRH